MDESILPEGFAEVWERVRAAAVDTGESAPPDAQSALETFIRRKRSSIAMYKCIIAAAGRQERAVLCRILADERRHLSSLQLEYFMLTGDNCVVSDTEKPSRPEGGLLSALRSAAIAEAESAAEYEKAAQTLGGETGAVFAAIGNEDSGHARTLRCLIARCFTQQG
jgi:rubrerythrin